MSRLRGRTSHRKGEEKPFHFQQCPGCHFDFLTGEGSRSCGWYDCPYLPEDLKVFCPKCNFDFVTGEGNPHCGDPPDCEWSAEGYRHAAAARKYFGGSP